MMRELPPYAAQVLGGFAVAGRLRAHLAAVHDTAWEITDGLAGVLGFDREAVLFGAATHDMGKLRHPSELHHPGKLHEAAGRDLLLEAGVDPGLARFAGTHGGWDESRPVEDLLVSLADKVWKGHRVTDLEQLIVDRIASRNGFAAWEAFLRLDDVLQPVAARAGARLAYQNAYPL